ncbi:hypothetical protein BGAL_0074g00130 [Botrytis galanthina]|uniref:Uncharacterized protein n=1 Tax=Botrytis galanthina TaxID=278940 RepID=A0A4S8R6T7_9HELO|nr:hypothetical protein BGAL_0074g00130 [Botrytis galanthina]
MGGSTASLLFVKLCGFFLNLDPSVDLGANRARQKFANSKAARQMNCVADVRRDILANYVDICTTTPAMKMDVHRWEFWASIFLIRHCADIGLFAEEIFFRKAPDRYARSSLDLINFAYTRDLSHRWLAAALIPSSAGHDMLSPYALEFWIHWEEEAMEATLKDDIVDGDDDDDEDDEDEERET